MWLYTLLILVGCTEEAYLESTSSMTDEEIYAVIENENTDSRTYIDEQIRMRWTAEDCITLFRKTTYNRKYMFTGKTGANAGGFKQVSTDDDFWYGADVSYNYAAYPYSADMELDESGYFKLTMPAEQTYAENSFGLGANTMVAISESGQLTFKNVCSYLRVRLYGENTSISSITLTSKGDEAIAGAAKVTPVMGGNPTCEMTGTGKSIKLVCPNPVTISSDANSPTDFWIVVPPVTLTSGFNVTVQNNEGETQIYEVAKSFTFERNVYYNLAREVKIETRNIPYVTFTADAPQSFAMSQAVSTLEYSLNGGEWKELGTNTVIFGGDNGNLRLRGKNSNGTADPTYYYYSSSANPIIKFGNATLVACMGDIRTLLDYENYTTVSTNYARFSYLFYGCYQLTSPPKLPAIKLASNCYDAMFCGCDNLTKAPELPATVVTPSCYYSMFSGCSSLSEAPQLPATVLESQCYRGMFSGCSSLIEAPKLPATILASYCYFDMFAGCSSLIETPELPATTLAEHCYTEMFYGCNSLTKAPILPATNLAEHCYDRMFYSCDNLTEAPELPATTLATNCYEEMFGRCSSLTKAPKLPATILASYCYYRMFQYCDNLTEVPELPATTLANFCYSEMFEGCSSLTNAPELPAMTLAEGCYYNMFGKCSNLIKAPQLPATTLAETCYSWMFYDCISLTEAPQLPATTLAETCYSLMFSGCSSLIEAPQLPATTLAKECYYSMFSRCSNLKSITMLATDISASDCLYNWLKNVASFGTFTKAASMTSLPSGSSGIPSGWTIVDYTE